MKTLPKTDKRNWEFQAGIHVRCCPHTNWWFLPWHRVYLHYFEQICRDVLQHADFALPYWDWTRYPYLPDPFLEENSPLWNDGRALGGSVAVPLASVSRAEIGKILAAQDMTQIYSGKTNADDQSASSTTGEFEDVPHGAIHTAVGGDMWTKLSPLDPIFWLHHCNVDRIWESWAVLHNWAVPAEKMWADHQLNQFYDPVSRQQVSVQCAQTVNSPLFGAQYDLLETFDGHLPSSPLPTLQVQFGPGEQISVPPETTITLQTPFSGDSAKVAENKTTFALSISQDLDELLDRVVDPRSPGFNRTLPAAFLLLDGVALPRSPTTLLRLFLNVLDPSNSTPMNNPGYVATASFFGNFDHHGEQRTADFSFNISSNVAQLTNAGRRPKGKLIVTLFTVDLLNPGGAKPPEPVVPRKLRIVGLE